MTTDEESWLSSLITETPEIGYELAVSLSRSDVTLTQTSPKISEHLRTAYAQDVNALIASSHVVAVHFQTVAAANNWWRGGK